MARLLAVLITGLLLSGCSGQTTKELLNTLEFGEDEVGCFRVNGSVNLGGNPFASTEVHVNLVKKKGGDDAPDC